ncbi:MAG: pyrroloquinoline-quinone synthase [Thermoleophilaceae bacterium]|jgi:pyrroloquinoline-quinone synthase|nr:pyrroloquinoline-quinone synthase [Thermoleophilaceae bacterium]
MEFFERLDAVRTRWNVLEHSFYQRWSAGELTREELSYYAAEYRHAVEALAVASEQAADFADASARAEMQAHAREERQHIELWQEFERALDADSAREPRMETIECAEAWTAARNSLEGLAILYAVEAAQPAISQTKLEGLTEHYGMEPDSPATEYFSLHATLDHEHAAEGRAMLEERLSGADADRLIEVAEAALKGNWTLLDGVEKNFGR